MITIERGICMNYSGYIIKDSDYDMIKKRIGKIIFDSGLSNDMKKILILSISDFLNPHDYEKNVRNFNSNISEDMDRANYELDLQPNDDFENMKDEIISFLSSIDYIESILKLELIINLNKLLDYNRFSIDKSQNMVSGNNGKSIR